MPKSKGSDQKGQHQSKQAGCYSYTVTIRFRDCQMQQVDRHVRWNSTLQLPAPQMRRIPCQEPQVSNRICREAAERIFCNPFSTLRLCRKSWTNKTHSVAFSPQANYTDWATATCWRNLLPTFADSGMLPGQRGGNPTAVNLSFLNWSRYFSLK
jgi:hypothetical protein